jgi:hypothetical protein
MVSCYLRYQVGSGVEEADATAMTDIIYLELDYFPEIAAQI